MATGPDHGADLAGAASRRVSACQLFQVSAHR
ncbi:hypothetical protein MAG26fr_orf012 [Klebsiella phage vB_KpnS_MAG26fr]|nr:hypothetical protein MAG26fr_orf012 [Klebsiella phage vB_KpnS_MAG26fr]